MNKWIIFAGVIVSGVLLYKFQTGDIVTNDVFEIMGPVVPDVEDVESDSDLFDSTGPDLKPDGYFESYDGDKSFHDRIISRVDEDFSFDNHVYAAILTPSLSNARYLAEFFVGLKNTQEVDTFVILGENHSRKGYFHIASANYGYETPFGNLEPDLDLISALGIDMDSLALKKEASISIYAPFIKNIFPDVKIVPISIKEFAKEDKLFDLAENLAKKFDKNTVLIASTLYSQNLDRKTSLFHSELTENLIETMDESGINQMDVDSKNVIFALFKYLKFIEAETADINENFVTFHEGDPVSDDRALTIMAFGDMMLGRYVRTLMNQYGMSYIFDNIAGYENRFFEGADVVFGNLEGPIKGEGSSGGTSMVFAFNEDIVPFLKKYGFNLVSIANNHATDQGWSGRDTTIETLNNAGLNWCGHPSEADSNSVYYGKVGDKKYAFLCFHDVTYKLDDEAALSLIKSVRPNVDYLIVSIHWGYEYGHIPDYASQIEPAHAFIDAGVDFIIGHHPHVVQSFEVYNGKLIFYSLGNFVFDQYWSTETQEELAIGIYLNDRTDEFVTKVYLFPMKSELSQSRLMTDEEKESWILEFIEYGDYDEEMEKMIKNGIIEVEK